MAARGAGVDFDPIFLVVGVVVVVTLVTLPFVGRFFSAALAGGVVIAGVMLLWRLRRPH